MAIEVNLLHLTENNLRLKGELDVSELDPETLDELIRLKTPLCYDLEVQKVEEGVLVRGRATLDLDCECVRCLQPFVHRVDLGDWACHLPLQGDDAVAVSNDCVDLTPHLREDIFLAFPRHPLCRPDCEGLLRSYERGPDGPSGEVPSEESSSTWADLNKLKL
jgi:uncharacterized protein